MYDAIKAFSPDFALFTGDIVDHAIWNTTVEQNSADITTAYQHMADTGLLVYGTVGNHEMSPANAIPPSHLGNSAQWLYEVVSEAWKRWISSPAEVKEIGAYSVKYPNANLRIISVSTNMWYTLNFWLYKDVKRDPSNHLQWLVGQLDKAEKAGERVYLVGHMPMGTSDALHDGSNYLDQVVNRYRSSIAGMFFGESLAYLFVCTVLMPVFSRSHSLGSLPDQLLRLSRPRRLQCRSHVLYRAVYDALVRHASIQDLHCRSRHLRHSRR